MFLSAFKFLLTRAQTFSPHRSAANDRHGVLLVIMMATQLLRGDQALDFPCRL